MSAPSISAREFARRAGCDEKQVRRALTAGRLHADAGGLLDPAQLKLGWRKATRASGRKGADKSKVSADMSAQLSAPVSALEVRDDETPAVAASRLVREFGAEHDLNEAIRIKENYNAMLKRLEYEEKEGTLVELALAEQVLFEGGRAARDAWLNFPSKIGPMLAAELGLEADKVTETLTTYVHKQIAELGEPEADFAAR
ncbi:hypothetical protein [Variovorax sp. PBL-E5]|uniref:hypothetical protein n=1 Tax=Variovorax sp. PBL-E5 TaxID=434014 RepID=UPI0013162031|nr:hypothetical protein [Variovorax sp. PBL-E5]VTU36206.1 hypothetical protein E5CHR_04255 [Variovorax sp. PBL-E5]